ncbi:MAG: hypothetical protein RIR62_444, partial [Pseudomonadota bacterium]
MLRFDLLGTLGGVRFRAPAADACLVAAGNSLTVINATSGETVPLFLGAGALPVAGEATAHGARVTVTVDGVTGGLLPDLIAAARLAGAEGHSLRGGLAAGGGFAQAVEVIAVTLPSGASLLYAARPAGSGIDRFALGPDGTLAFLGRMADGAGVPLASVAAMATVQVGGAGYLLAGSQTEHGLTAFRIGADGALAQVATLTQGDGLPVQTITAMQTVVMGGASFAIVAAAGSSSLTVVRILDGGGMVITDQLIDELGTRFAGATVLDVVTHQGRVFVVAAGSDDGITLLTLLPDGTLQVLDVLADGLTTSLADISAVRAVVVGNELQVAVLSGIDAGLTVLRVDLSTLGATGTATALDDVVAAPAGGGSVAAGAGADIVLDSAGSDLLSGGAGGDLFVLGRDGVADTILDFDPAV